MTATDSFMSGRRLALMKLLAGGDQWQTSMRLAEQLTEQDETPWETSRSVAGVMRRLIAAGLVQARGTGPKTSGREFTLTDAGVARLAAAIALEVAADAGTAAR